MKKTFFSLTIVLLFSTTALIAMDSEQIPLDEITDEITTVDIESGDIQINSHNIPLKKNSTLEKFKTLFRNHTADEIIPRLQEFNNNQQQTLLSIKHWLKDQKVNNDQPIFSFVKNVELQSACLVAFPLSLYAGILTSSKNAWPIAVACYVFFFLDVIALVCIKKKNYELENDIKASMYKNKKITTLLSAISDMKNKNLSTRLKNED